MNRRHFSAASAGLLSALLLSSGSARGQGAAPVEGKDFTRLEPPQPVREPGKIEVLEFFSYACPHCSTFEPTLDHWARQLPADVVFRRVPVPFLMNAENFQRTYYALESLGLVPTVQQKIFRAIHVDRQRLEKPEDIAAFVGKNGGDEAKFLAAFKSFSVATSVSRAKKAMADYKVESVPLLVINGRYVTSPSMAGGAPQALAVADQLIQRSRAK
ncbi:MAG TPA: thiol:disulfide interchange protein DsbA/DsbL [Caldimonas sp.]|jgi:thiol:disulfide interchange protein DsbA|nr:thiol:disulfide interchange protein DsbA/DsbL [Caldimonas sp.]HEX2539810.1 thiol:disulfide interchange protein DsbA/DsbL [Caldimonas sp.]